MRYFWLITLLVLGGCSSIPLSTMLKFSSFDKEDVAAIAPEQLRVQILIEDPAQLDIEATELKLSSDSAKGLQRFDYPLELVEATQLPAEKGFFSTTPVKNVYLLQLSEVAVENFRETQELIVQDYEQSFSFSVEFGLNEMPKDATSVRLSILLKLSQTEDFITLFDDAEIAFTE